MKRLIQQVSFEEKTTGCNNNNWNKFVVICDTSQPTREGVHNISEGIILTSPLETRGWICFSLAATHYQENENRKGMLRWGWLLHHRNGNFIIREAEIIYFVVKLSSLIHLLTISACKSKYESDQKSFISDAMELMR